MDFPIDLKFQYSSAIPDSEKDRLINTGHTLFTQVIDLLPLTGFCRCFPLSFPLPRTSAFRSSNEEIADPANRVYFGQVLSGLDKRIATAFRKPCDKLAAEALYVLLVGKRSRGAAFRSQHEGRVLAAGA